MNIDQAMASYRNDATFKRVVDTMEDWIRQANATPAEVRAAAMLACIHFEEKMVHGRNAAFFQKFAMTNPCPDAAAAPNPQGYSTTITGGGPR